MKSRHTLRWILAALIFGTAVLPCLVYLTGVRILGPYGPGGVGAFYGMFLRDLAQPRPAAWTLALGPAVLVLAWRVVTAFAWADDA